MKCTARAPCSSTDSSIDGTTEELLSREVPSPCAVYTSTNRHVLVTQVTMPLCRQVAALGERQLPSQVGSSSCPSHLLNTRLCSFKSPWHPCCSEVLQGPVLQGHLQPHKGSYNSNPVIVIRAADDKAVRGRSQMRYCLVSWSLTVRMLLQYCTSAVKPLSHGYR